MLMFMYCPKPVLFSRNKDLKTGEFTRYTGFVNVDPRYFEDLRARTSPMPLLVPSPRLKMTSFSSSGIPVPLSSRIKTSPDSISS